MAGKLVRFHLYRYQLLPKDRYYQPPFFADNGPRSIEELLERKNDYFYEALMEQAFKSPRTDLMAQKLLDKDDFLLYRIAANRSLTEKHVNFPSNQLRIGQKF